MKKPKIGRYLSDNVLPFVDKDTPVFMTVMNDIKHSLRDEKLLKDLKKR